MSKQRSKALPDQEGGARRGAPTIADMAAHKQAAEPTKLQKTLKQVFGVLTINLEARWWVGARRLHQLSAGDQYGSSEPATWPACVLQEGR